MRCPPPGVRFGLGGNAPGLQWVGKAESQHKIMVRQLRLAVYGYQVGKISMKEQTVLFQQLDPQEEPA